MASLKSILAIRRKAAQARTKLNVDGTMEWLSKLMLFKKFDPSQLFKIANSLTVRVVGPGHIIVEEGNVVGTNDAGEMYFVQSGKVDVTRALTDGERAQLLSGKPMPGVVRGRKFLARLSEGTYFGESASQGTVRSARVAANGSVVLLCMSIVNQTRFFDSQVRESVQRVAMLRKACTTPSGRRTRQHIAALKTLVLDFDFFRALPPETLDTVVQRLVYQVQPSDSIVVRQAEVGDCLYILISGGCDVLIKSTDAATGKQSLHKVAQLRPGTFFGEMALLEPNSRRGATVQTNAHTELMRLSRSTYEEVLHGDGVMGLREKVNFVNTCSALSSLTDRLLITKLCCLMQERSCSKHDFVFHAGEAATGAFFVVEGSVQIIRILPEDPLLPAKIDVTKVGPGELFGEITSYTRKAAEAARARAQLEKAPKGKRRDRVGGAEGGGDGDHTGEGSGSGVGGGSVGRMKRAPQSRFAPPASHYHHHHHHNHHGNVAGGATYFYSALALSPVRLLFVAFTDIDRRVPADLRRTMLEAAADKYAFRERRVQQMISVYRSPEPMPRKLSRMGYRDRSDTLLTMLASVPDGKQSLVSTLHRQDPTIRRTLSQRKSWGALFHQAKQHSDRDLGAVPSRQSLKAAAKGASTSLVARQRQQAAEIVRTARGSAGAGAGAGAGVVDMDCTLANAAEEYFRLHEEPEEDPLALGVCPTTRTVSPERVHAAGEQMDIAQLSPRSADTVGSATDVHVVATLSASFFEPVDAAAAAPAATASTVEQQPQQPQQQPQQHQEGDTPAGEPPQRESAPLDSAKPHKESPANPAPHVPTLVFEQPIDISTTRSSAASGNVDAVSSTYDTGVGSQGGRVPSQQREPERRVVHRVGSMRPWGAPERNNASQLPHQRVALSYSGNNSRDGERETKWDSFYNSPARAPSGGRLLRPRSAVPDPAPRTARSTGSHTARSRMSYRSHTRQRSGRASERQRPSSAIAWRQPYTQAALLHTPVRDPSTGRSVGDHGGDNRGGVGGVQRSLRGEQEGISIDALPVAQRNEQPATATATGGAGSSRTPVARTLVDCTVPAASEVMASLVPRMIPKPPPTPRWLSHDHVLPKKFPRTERRKSARPASATTGGRNVGPAQVNAPGVWGSNTQFGDTVQEAAALYGLSAPVSAQGWGGAGDTSGSMPTGAHGIPAQYALADRTSSSAAAALTISGVWGGLGDEMLAPPGQPEQAMAEAEVAMHLTTDSRTMGFQGARRPASARVSRALAATRKGTVSNVGERYVVDRKRRRRPQSAKLWSGNSQTVASIPSGRNATNRSPRHVGVELRGTRRTYGVRRRPASATATGGTIRRGRTTGLHSPQPPHRPGDSGGFSRDSSVSVRARPATATSRRTRGHHHRAARDSQEHGPAGRRRMRRPGRGPRRHSARPSSAAAAVGDHRHYNASLDDTIDGHVVSIGDDSVYVPAGPRELAAGDSSMLSSYDTTMVESTLGGGGGGGGDLGLDGAEVAGMDTSSVDPTVVAVDMGEPAALAASLAAEGNVRLL